MKIFGGKFNAELGSGDGVERVSDGSHTHSTKETREEIRWSNDWWYKISQLTTRCTEKRLESKLFTGHLKILRNSWTTYWCTRNIFIAVEMSMQTTWSTWKVTSQVFWHNLSITAPRKEISQKHTGTRIKWKQQGTKRTKRTIKWNLMKQTSSKNAMPNSKEKSSTQPKQQPPHRSRNSEHEIWKNCCGIRTRERERLLTQAKASLHSNGIAFAETTESEQADGGFGRHLIIDTNEAANHSKHEGTRLVMEVAAAFQSIGTACAESSWVRARGWRNCCGSRSTRSGWRCKHHSPLWVKRQTQQQPKKKQREEMLCWIRKNNKNEKTIEGNKEVRRLVEERRNTAKDETHRTEGIEQKDQKMHQRKKRRETSRQDTTDSWRMQRHQKKILHKIWKEKEKSSSRKWTTTEAKQSRPEKELQNVFGEFFSKLYVETQLGEKTQESQNM